MSNKTLLVLGNGFDLDLGLKTSFKDFIASSSYNTRCFDTSTFQMIKENEKWGDIEGVIRKAMLKVASCEDISADEDINITWQLLRRGWGTYLPQYIDDIQNSLMCLNGEELLESNSSINFSSCAYALASRIKDWGTVFSFNYTNPADLLFGIWPNDIHFIHGSFIPHKHESYPLYQIADFLAIGVDYRRINEQILNRGLLSPIIKLNFVMESQLDAFRQAMIKAENIIVFGHSMSITDSDYFEDFFKEMENGMVANKNLFFVTYSEDSLIDIKKSMYEWNVDYERLVASNNEIIPVFTKNGSEHKDFLRMLEMV